jgi:tetratricopeptide (TPR) repeat protein
MKRRHEVRWLILLAISAWPVLPASSWSLARAQEPAEVSAADTAARTAFEAGRRAYDHGSFAEALAQFERANALSPRPELLYNIGRAADSDGQSARAITAYTSYLDGSPNADNRAFVQARLEKMRSLEILRASPQAAGSGLPSVAASTPSTTTNGSAEPLAALHHDDDFPKPYWKRAWFWTAAGAVVVAGLTAGLLATRHHDPKRSAADAYVVTPEAR